MRGELDSAGTSVVHAAVADWLPDALDSDRLAAMLGQDHARLRRIAQPQLRARFAASRLLLKSAAAAALDTSAEDLELAYRPGGRPYLRGIDQLDVSLSHTEELLVVGLARHGRIGVDVEFADRRMLSLGTERMVCTPHELEALRGMAEENRNRELVRLWTLKEAYSKAIGQGLRFPFTGFGFDPGDERARMLRPDGSPVAGVDWTFHSWLLDDEYMVSAAVHDPGFGDRRRSGGVPLLAPPLSAPGSTTR
ncbi:4'-phosphopantetheinyl transferase family protein [Streptomyces sp. ME02-8801-2C]|uniref:4'-phosphopantetheinyl transferase family protein n=1 Tax=Streptomyces sp. ME02-8801-2C TaxID=3028680 RepID=UPI0029C06EBB|nr:4'-phosphopantetheinyl transferase superfamily protein [Streptomyces sp. ME02-8801-2C]